ncbi:MAG TPA: hypothetical protein QGF95_06795 [Candidatus Latescibacteria bacterium]|nr:hypothetical protein [Gemmatimonadaceae bacterium]MDP6014569.1 hypothetical protein [Candidatus Latescibacterota bacterium]HJP30245.1 hypothetical protein [Candidatus Latescibacterota bacterium]
MSDWLPLETADDVSSIAARRDPLAALAAAEIPAVILRGAYPAADCAGLVDRFIEHDLMRDPRTPPAADARTRTDIGTSLGNLGADPAGFFSHAAGTEALFSHLFDNHTNPVDCIYDSLQALAGDKRVVTAHEPDGRRYGPAIFRVHYDGHAYKPHIDHVVLREKRFDYAVSRYSNQFAGVLCIQNAASRSTTQGILHHCLWTEEVQPHLADGTFAEYASHQGIDQCRVELKPGDLYFFNTRLIHEVPAVLGDNPRIVLAVFIGYEPADPEVSVWS